MSGDYDPTAGVTVSAVAGTTPVRLGVFGKILAALFLAMMLTVLISVAIWPGEMKLLAPLFCTDAQPDAFVVTDSYQVTPGETSYNFSMYCMGPRGDVTNVGVWKPYGTLFGIHLIISFGIIAWLGSGNDSGSGGKPGGRKRRARSTRPPGSTAGPFVS